MLSSPVFLVQHLGLSEFQFGWLFIPTVCGMVLGSYLALQVVYTLWLKHIALVDVIVISVGFVLRALAGAVVIREAQIGYLSPVAGDARARCGAPPAEEWERFVALFRRRGMARLTLHSELLDEAGGVAVRFSGQFVLQREAHP